MPPQAARSITSYFNKTPSKVAATTAAASSGTAKASSPPPPLASFSVSAAAAPSSPLTDVKSSPSVPGSAGTKRGLLSDAARQAIRDGLKQAAPADPEAEPASKRIKLDPKPTTLKTADVFTKAASLKSAKVHLPRAESREELRKALAEHPDKLALLITELDTMGEDWLLALQEELIKPYFTSLKEFVTAEQAKKKVFPPADEIYSWSTLCPLKDVKVVIIGQDPYHGLAFSVRKGVRIPPSLRNIYKELGDAIPGFVIPKHGDLTEWAKHGVLLLNTSLTVRAHEAGSHSKKGWEEFTAAVLRVVTSRLSPVGGEHLAGANGVCFMAWGAHAQKMCAGVDTKKHLVLKSVHPSPLSASRGFFGNGNFVRANEWLRERYGPDGGIDWASLGAGGDKA
ncbi:putative uracil DNA N-glycosylase [Dioszegia hungarica]|uniref:Uracil-DNA glycosylase n=1 Tax=Dioszegia hungarica TaxID=4972 RepID=A0AA38H677_9TREE|nr:putative uracil DNA N-glycosylase [Dioszegia hungarica]KAI9633596.1 putative uracil DNA N-glycosylase [Dioszegia hungarica]